ncbi:BLOC-1-related complex subunit 8 isoform X1 [Cygnus atratus]|uniref:BLOC-1-related complex subunit 8 isoform X1 n=1 Tax=Cygnus atratus TaxID=8868 RepID=UPI0015D61427|nr:BLOC-1-related complex subunit 8 isoform X1 [Cygnus atratus]
MCRPVDAGGKYQDAVWPRVTAASTSVSLLWPLLPSCSASQHLLPWVALPAGAAVASLHEEERAVLPAVAVQSDMQSWEEQSQGAIYTVEYACSAIKNMTDSSVYFKSIDSLLKHAIAMKDQLNAAQGRSTVAPQAKNPPASS